MRKKITFLILLTLLFTAFSSVKAEGLTISDVKTASITSNSAIISYMTNVDSKCTLIHSTKDANLDDDALVSTRDQSDLIFAYITPKSNSNGTYYYEYLYDVNSFASGRDASIYDKSKNIFYYKLICDSISEPKQRAISQIYEFKTITSAPTTCSVLQADSLSNYYFNICSANRFAGVCFNKYSSEYQGCNKSGENHCTQNNSNADSNILCSVTIPFENADLVINSAEVTKKDYSGTVKNILTVSYSNKYNGNYASKWFRIKITDKNTGYTDKRDFDLGDTMKALEQKIVEFFLDYKNYNLEIFIDSENAVKEENENNNIFEKTITIQNSTSTIPSITVLSPDGGEKFVQGTQNVIKWSGGKNKVKIGLKKIMSTNFVEGWIALEGVSNASITWDGKTICDLKMNNCRSVLPGEYKIIVVSEDVLGNYCGDQGCNYDYSDKSFSIVSAPECQSICKNVGTRSEGWYDSCTGKLIKWENCDESDTGICVKENESLGAVVPDNNKQCCLGLTSYIESGIIGTRGVCKKIFDQQIDKINTAAGQLKENKLDEILTELRQLRDRIKEQASEIKYLRKLTVGIKGLTQTVKDAINNFITYGVDSNTQKLGAGERAAVINSYKSAFDKLPQTEAELVDAIKIANGRFPSVTSDKAENAAKKQFVKIYKRVADLNDAKDNAAIKVMAYGLRQKAENRNLNSEKAGIKIFKAIYGYIPKTTEDWNVMQAITYSGATR